MEGSIQREFLTVGARVTTAAMLAVFLLLGVPLLVSAAERDVVINELMWVGSTLSSLDEWIELFNTTNSDIDIGGWTIENAASKQGLVEIPIGSIIPAGGYFVIARYGAEHEKAAFDMAVGPVPVNISLADDKNGELVLRSTAERDNEVDRAIARFGGEDEGGRRWLLDKIGSSEVSIRKSVERIDPEGEGQVIDNWSVSSISVDGNNFGTPGEQNSEPVVNEAPEAFLAGPSEVVRGETVEFTAEDSFDPDGENENLTYLWTIDDMEVSSKIILEYVFTEVGQYELGVTVSDGEDEDRASVVIKVEALIYTDDIVINELLPNPVGLDKESEFIELYNTGDSVVDLSGWKIDGKGIPKGTEIGALGWLVLKRDKIKFGSLSNGGDSVVLQDPNSEAKDTVTYSKAKEGESYNRKEEGGYEWSTTPTPGEENSITLIEDEDEGDEEEEDESRVGVGGVAGAKISKIALKDLRLEKKGTLVEVTGVVSVPPGVLGDRIIYLAGSGAQVYFSQAAWPELKLGDAVSLVGEVSSVSGETRLKLKQATDLSVTSAGAPPVAHVMETGEVGEATEGWLVTIQGHVTETSGDTFYVDDGSGEIKIYIKSSTNIDKPPMKKGAAVTITGVVSETSSGYRVLPRWQEDVRLGLVAGMTSFPATGKSVAWLVVVSFLVGLLFKQARQCEEPLVTRWGK